MNDSTEDRSHVENQVGSHHETQAQAHLARWGADLAIAARTLGHADGSFVAFVEGETIINGGLDAEAAVEESRLATCARMIIDPSTPIDVVEVSEQLRLEAQLDDRSIKTMLAVGFTDDRRNLAGIILIWCSRTSEWSDAAVDGLRCLATIAAHEHRLRSRHQAILSASLDAIITIDASGMVLEFNQPACDMFDYTREETIGRPLAELIIPPALRDAHRAGMQRFIETGEGRVIGRRIEITAIRRNQEEFPVELTVSPVRFGDAQCFTAFVRDLSATHELNRNLRLTRFTVEHSRELIFWVAPDARILYANQTACSALGYSLDEFRTMSVFDIEARLEPDQWPDHWQELRESGSLVIDSMHKRRDGSIFPVEVLCNHVEHEGLEMNCVVARDTTERLEAEEALTASETRFQDIASAAGEFIWELDAAGRFTFVSEPLEKQLGLDASDILAQPMHDFLVDDDRERLARLLSQARATGKPFTNEEFRTTHPDGRIRWHRLTGKALMAENDAATGFRGIGLDITAAKLADEENRRLIQLQNIAHSAVATFLEPARLLDGVTTMIRDIGAHYGAQESRLERLDRDHGWVTVDDISMLASDALASDIVNAGGTPMNRDDLAVSLQPSGRLNGSCITLDVRVEGVVAIRIALDGVPIDREFTLGEQETLLGIVRGMGHAIERASRKRALLDSAEALTEALKRANAASDAKSTFLAQMSHELRTPLTAVLGLTRILQTGTPTPEEQKLFLEKIDQNGRSLLEIINSILDLSQFERDSATVRLDDTHVPELLSATWSAVAPAIREKNLDARLIASNPLPVLVHTDALRVRQILTNLLSNAAKYTDDGFIEFAIEKTSLAGQDALTFTVRDSGRGIAEESLSSVFRAFEREKAAAEIAGTGLGLAIVQRLVDLLSGTIEVHSRLGEGSTFTVTIPVSSVSEETIEAGPIDPDQLLPSDAPAAISTLRLEGARVLLVEDSRHVREVIHYFLTERGATVTTRANGKEAVETLTEDAGRYDLVLMDMKMPVMDGYEATRTLRDRDIRIPIVALTAHGLEHDRALCLNAGCDDYLSKPVDPETLASVCCRLLGRSADGSAHPRPISNAPPVEVSQSAMMKELRARFIIHLSHERAALSEPHAIMELDDTRRRIHNLAGSAGNVGFPEISEVARVCESTIRQGESEERIQDAIDALVNAIDAALD